MQKHFVKAIALVAGLALLALTGSLVPATVQAQGQVTLTGAGSTFAAPLYGAWAQAFIDQAGVQINYQGIGSGGGIQAIQNQSIDFGGTDAFLQDPNIENIPTAAGAVVLSYNLPGVSCTLSLDNQTLADIFLGNVTKWNDKELATLNPDCNLPNQQIIVVHRSDGSGTTSIFTSYLSTVSDQWKNNVGSGTTVNWPTDALGGLGGKGNPGVAQAISQNPYSLGYVELIYALQNDISFATMKNAHGDFVVASLKTTTNALGGLASIPSDFDISPLTLNVDAPNAYPIVGPTYIMVYKDLRNIHSQDKAQALVDMLCWGVSSNSVDRGQDFTTGLDYASLPSNIQDEAKKRIEALTYQGNTLTSKYCQ